MLKIVSKTVIAMLLALVVFQISNTAFCQRDTQAIEEAKHHMELGQTAFAAKDFKTAHKHFMDAYGATPFPAFLYNAGLAAERAGNYEAAGDLYSHYLKSEPKASDKDEIQDKIRLLRKIVESTKKAAEQAEQTGQTDAQPDEPAPKIEIIGKAVEMKSLITVRANPQDAEIRILNLKGKEVTRFKGPNAQTVQQGEYWIEANHPDFRTVRTPVRVGEGQVYVVVVEMSQGAFLGLLSITTDVHGAKVYVDDKSKGALGETPWQGVVETGEHSVIIEKPGYKPITKKLNIEVGDKEKHHFKLERLDFGVLLVKANVAQKAMVYVDNELVGNAPLEHQLRPGKHTVKVVAEDMKDHVSEVEIARGQVTKVLVRLNPKPSRRPGWITGGFAVAAFTAGAITGGMSYKIKKGLRADQKNGSLSDDDPRMKKGFVLALAADGSLAVGAVASLVALYYFVRDPLPPSEGKSFDPEDLAENPSIQVESDKKSKPTVSVAPIVAPSQYGLGLNLTF